MKYTLRSIEFICVVLCVVSCKVSGDIYLQQDFDTLGLSIVDTFSIQSSTYALDPLPTSATGRLLLGHVVDQDLGKLTASTYFRLANNSMAYDDIPVGVQYDSLTLELYYDGYSYGDTTQIIPIQVHRLTEDIALTEPSVALEDDEYPVFVSGSAIFSDRTFSSEPSAIGASMFTPRPHSTTDTVSVKLDDNLGKELFQMMLNQDGRLSDGSEFLNYFKGLYLHSADQGGAIIGLQDSVSMSLHYSYERQSDGLRVSNKLVFGMGELSYQYNRLSADRSQTQFASLSHTTSGVSSAITNGSSYIQGATGIVTRFSFPSVASFKSEGNYVISKATLIVQADQIIDSNTPPPTSLVLMVANRYGTPASLVVDRSGNTVTANYVAGEGNSGSYEFDLTYYVASVFLQSSYDQNKTLLLSIPPANLTTEVSKLKISSGTSSDPAMKLEILYVTY